MSGFNCLFHIAVLAVIFLLSLDGFRHDECVLLHTAEANQNWQNVELLPPMLRNNSDTSENFDQRIERTLIAIKPESVERGLIGAIIQRFENNAFHLIAMKMVRATKQQAKEHYWNNKERPFFPKLLNYMTSGPVVVMIWEGVDAVKRGRKMLGANPNKEPPALGTIRGDFQKANWQEKKEVGHDSICHGSDSVGEAHREIAIWFTPDEIPKRRNEY